ncbi:MFS transporter [Actinomadura sp. BRA 177]|uniref:MFS transporter n=1 Tax=Actinomadura sp. BRA 177 TaxID=2745202 RepID=UPI001827ADD4|nr:MFS transporter [Actinomadura sp. BRA 177]NVI86896.1 MFS transporter [Actinomadura sp. BRA 177]
MNVQASRTDSEAERPVGGPGFGLVLFLCAQFMVMLDASIVTVAIPSIQHDLGFSSTGVQMVITAYNTAFGGALILCGRIGDLLGRRRVFVIGMIAFAATSLLCGLSESALMLVGGRVLQGFSAALIAPNALALLTSSTPEGPARAKAMSKFGMATVLGFISGLVFSGLLVRAWGWQSVFYVTVPVGLLVALLAPRFIREAPRRPHKIDVVGAVLITLGVALIVAAPAQSVASGFASASFLAPLAAGAALLVAFLWLETRHPEPLVRLALFRSPVIRSANLVSVASGFCSGAAYLLTTMFLQEVRGYSPLEAGLIVAPVGVLNIALGFVLGKWITRLGIRVSITAATLGSGLLIALVGSQVSDTANIWVFAVVLLPMGMAFMATTVTSTLAATTGVADHEQGLAAGVRQTSFQLGIAVGVAVLIPIASGHAASPGDLAEGIRTALLVLAAIVGVAGVVTYFGMGRPTGQR